MTGWRTVLLKGFGFGVGFALVCITAAGAWLWHSNRPKPPQPWNTHAITATYEFVTTPEGKNDIVYVYTLQNNTNEDYRLTEGSGVDIFHRLLREKSIYRTLGEEPKIDFPVFVPASGRATVVIDDHSEYSGQKPSDGDSKKLRANVQEFVKVKHPNLGGFVLFDQTHRYQIELPKGW